MKNRTIIATVGPASFKKEKIIKMDEAGVDYFRINLSHTNIKDFTSIVEELKSWTSKPICPDTEGAQLRTAIITENIEIKTHNEVTIVNKQNLCENYVNKIMCKICENVCGKLVKV